MKLVSALSSSLTLALVSALFGNNKLFVSAQDKNLADVAIENGFTTLVAAANATGLLGVLETINSPLTVFAPTDAAFAALPAGALDHLLANPGDLGIILGYHTVFGNLTSDDLTDGLVLATSTGLSLTVSNDGSGTIKINDAGTLNPVDLLASNGVIHGLDQVLVPLGFSFPLNIYETAVAADGFNLLVAAIDAAGLKDALGANILTVFAPTDEAFMALPDGILDYLLSNTAALTEILLYHVVEGATASSALSDGMELSPLLQQSSLMVSIVNGTVFINDATVVMPDITALNGIIHVIDKVLVPPGFEFDISSAPSDIPSDSPSLVPSMEPSSVPSDTPSLLPSTAPSVSPSMPPTTTESGAPSTSVSASPSTSFSASPSLYPSSAPTDTPSAAPSPSPTPEPAFGFVVSNISDNRDWCLTAVQSGTDGNMGFRQCDYDRKPRNQQWKFKGGQFISGISGDAEDRCMKTGFGGIIFAGIRVRLGDCTDDKTTYIYDEITKYIHPSDDRSLCITNRGNSPNTDDTIHAKTCIVREDYEWSFVEI